MTRVKVPSARSTVPKQISSLVPYLKYGVLYAVIPRCGENQDHPPTDCADRNSTSEKLYPQTYLLYPLTDMNILFRFIYPVAVYEAGSHLWDCLFA